MNAPPNPFETIKDTVEHRPSRFAGSREQPPDPSDADGCVKIKVDLVALAKDEAVSLLVEEYLGEESYPGMSVSQWDWRFYIEDGQLLIYAEVAEFEDKEEDRGDY